MPKLSGIQSEWFQYWDENDDEFQCAGVALVRHTIQRRGILLPYYTNAPQLIYVVQGKGLLSQVVLRRTNQDHHHSLETEEHKKEIETSTRRFDQSGRVTSLLCQPEWLNGFITRVISDLVLVVLQDTLNAANQLDLNAREFYLAGNPQEQSDESRRQSRRSQGEQGDESRRRQGQGQSQRGEQQNGGNILSGLDTQIVADLYNINEEQAKNLQGLNDGRGRIVEAQDELRFLSPESQDDEREERRQQGRDNGIEETLCTLRLKYNIGNPENADIYNPRAGRITSLNSHTFPVLRRLQLSAERGFLYQNAFVAPFYNLNSNSLVYGLRGNGRIQVVNDNGDNVFDGELREGQALIVPQNFVVVKKAGDEGFEWVAFKTNDNAIVNPLAGQNSFIQALPLDVLANSFNLNREEAQRLKNNRQEQRLFSSNSRSQRRESRD
uniref:Cupin type-1 domain-containing protein n=1 Tax=Fagus sylvatica TaxID=28930 RepID=A0A2N9G8G2_FAGSY